MTDKRVEEEKIGKKPYEKWTNQDTTSSYKLPKEQIRQQDPYFSLKPLDTKHREAESE